MGLFRKEKRRRYLVFGNFSQPIFQNSLAGMRAALERRAVVRVVDLFPHCQGKPAAQVALEVPGELVRHHVATFRPDVIVCFGGGWYIARPDRPPNFEGKYLGLSLSDPAGLEASIQIAAHSDQFYTNDPDSVPLFRSGGYAAEALTAAVDPGLFQVDRAGPKDVDVLYIGRHTPGREEVLQRLAPHFTLRIHTHLGDTAKWGLPVHPPLGSCKEFAGQAARARFGMEQSRQDFTTYDGHWRIQDRTLFYLAAGCVPFLPRFPGLERYFHPSQEVVAFDSGEELVGMLRHFLSHPDQYESMRSAGYQRLLREYTWDVRWREIEEDISKPRTERS